MTVFLRTSSIINAITGGASTPLIKSSKVQKKKGATARPKAKKAAGKARGAVAKAKPKRASAKKAAPPVAAAVETVAAIEQPAPAE
jgi:hypothetical protein